MLIRPNWKVSNQALAGRFNLKSGRRLICLGEAIHPRSTKRMIMVAISLSPAQQLRAVFRPLRASQRAKHGAAQSMESGK